MARLIQLSFIFIVFSCATGKKSQQDLPLAQKNALFHTQEVFEVYNSFNDPLFAKLKTVRCLEDWQKYVFDQNSKLRKTKTNKERVVVWYELGNCYNYVKEYKKAIYYYDLVLSVEKNNSPMLSTILGNIGIIYELKGLNILAKSYYERSLSYNRKNHIVEYMIALDALRMGEFDRANGHLLSLSESVPGSRAIYSTLGVSFSLSDNGYELKSKVFKFFNEKEEERVLFEIALKLFAGESSKESIEDLKDMELKFPILNDYRNYLLNKFGSKNG